MSEEFLVKRRGEEDLRETNVRCACPVKPDKICPWRVEHDDEGGQVMSDFLLNLVDLRRMEFRRLFGEDWMRIFEGRRREIMRNVEFVGDLVDLRTGNSLALPHELPSEGEVWKNCMLCFNGVQDLLDEENRRGMDLVLSAPKKVQLEMFAWGLVQEVLSVLRSCWKMLKEK